MKKAGAREGQARVFSDTELDAVMKSIAENRHSVRNKALMMLTLRSGIRIGTAAGLTLDDILNADGSLKQVVVGRREIMKGSKTSTIFLSHPELREALEQWLSIRPKYKTEDRLFVSQQGKGFSPNALSKTMWKIYQKAGLEGFSSHSNRRTFATEVLKSGADIVALQTLMNHSNVSTTARYVSHNEEYLLKVVGSIS